MYKIVKKKNYYFISTHVVGNLSDLMGIGAHFLKLIVGRGPDHGNRTETPVATNLFVRTFPSAFGHVNFVPMDMSHFRIKHTYIIYVCVQCKVHKTRNDRTRTHRRMPLWCVRCTFLINAAGTRLAAKPFDVRIAHSI